ncbi:hypothetical protein BDY17DRAFT_306865 [Neohortaea acidophila]|uniref:Uncharacterized protein n=1 Tax=Neohortaea acidophila TaxID=245834 RepID=A0A6A6Q693_9PEZI|nr:uncharacterized protein BDY17DRAFT_306865 [Neohortaea acidophila]KAF2487486.1 hypothetical protein BDY17DRAFT_306865 [Neohortaea acidophila]
MSIESALRRLTLQPASICRQCRRSWSSSSVQRQQQSATAAFAGQLLASRNESTQSRAATIRSSATPTSTPPKTSAEPNKPVPRTSYDIASSIISDTAAASRRRAQELRASEVERPWSRADLERQTQRRWRVGDVYAPHDLSGAEQAKWKKFRRKGKQRHDDIDQLGINPIHHYKVRASKLGSEAFVRDR